MHGDASHEPAIRFISPAWARTRWPGTVLPRLHARIEPDEREADAVPRLERRVAELLGKPAAAMFATGTMAQQVALRIHADARGIRVVAFHPQCHLELHEHKGYAVVHGLSAQLVGDRYALITMDDLAAMPEPVAALLLELPQREIGGVLPGWEELVAQVGWARERGIATHMDGARLWESQPFYGRPYPEIAGLFDSVYVSMYKGLGGIAGAVLAGEKEFVEHARLWRDRLGGNVERAWPYAVSAERGLDELLPRMPEFADRARRLAAMLGAIPGAHVVPDPPQTPMFHLHLDVPPQAAQAVAERLAADTGITPPQYYKPSPSPRRCSIELTVNEQLDEVTDAEIGDLIAELVKRAG